MQAVGRLPCKRPNERKKSCIAIFAIAKIANTKTAHVRVDVAAMQPKIVCMTRHKNAIIKISSMASLMKNGLLIRLKCRVLFVVIHSAVILRQAVFANIVSA